MIQILDCTLRDGGYYTNWDFDKKIVDQYLTSMNNLPVDYLEIGYRSIPMKGYLGKYFYCPVYEIENVRKKTDKNLAIILNEKDVKTKDLYSLISPIQGLVKMIRIAIDPQNLNRAIKLAEDIKLMGFEVGFNVMYMSKWNEYGDFVKDLKNVDGVADYFYMVDSYGGVYPKDIVETIALVRSYTNCKLGFHGHNNLELALINSITAIENGVEIIDATILGMGRGAGNLKTELILTALNSKERLDVDFNSLSIIVNAFEDLWYKYQWGTNLPYMISGSNSLPQKDVMDWVTTRFYSFNSIIQALQNQKDNIKDNRQLPKFLPVKQSKIVMIIGGGKSAVEHADAIKEYIEMNKDIIVVHASSKNSYLYKDLSVTQIFCLVGSEGYRLEKIFKDLGDFNGVSVLPPFPRKMGTYVPECIIDKSFELNSVDFTKKFQDSHTALALQVAKEIGAKKVFLAGYDGYQEEIITTKERELTNENEFLFKKFVETTSIQLTAITSTLYNDLNIESVYSKIYEKQNQLFSTNT